MATAPPALILASRKRALTGSSRSLSSSYTNGEMVRVRAGVYFNKSAWLALKPWARYSATVAAVAATDPAIAFCYLTALRIWRLPSPRVPDHVHALTPTPHKAGRLPPTTCAAKDPKTGLTGLETVRSYGLFRHHWKAETVERRGFSVTSLVQTVLDCVVRLEFHHAVAIVDDVMGSRRPAGEVLTRAELEEASDCLGSAAKRRRFLEVLAFADEASESVGESRSRALIHVLGFPAPALQHSFHDDDGFIGRTDFYWRELGIIGEFDGDAKYLDDELLGGRTTREALLAEKKREDRLRALGYTVIRWDWKDASSLERLERKLTAGGLTRRNPRLMD
ncbi:endonuclease domain-containing protein [Pseudarthrobacter sulfonivorans]|uniref:endonuclease domain-containing protein n=1 Tax=Pseudarthrobacter sulfonivorans TaxID=121292 RepID=UPI00210726E7|nr:endonuclease domain-containing protein [Pseudarthrobacter sulfonivorans]